MEKMEQFLNKYHCNRWLLPVLVILFVLQMFTLPLMVNYTYADRPYVPEHQLTYTENRLRWDKNTHINAHGVAELDLFDAAYDNVKSDNGDNLIAPGTQGESSVRLVNDVAGVVRYTAVLYSIKSNDDIPVTPDLSAPRYSTPTEAYPLPPGVTRDQVLEAITGPLGGNSKLDFDIHWNWEFYKNDARDVIDTTLGNRDEEDITVGLYIVIVDENDYTLPKTADESHFGAYLTLMAVSGTLLILLLLEKRKETACESSNPSDDSSASV